MTHRIGSHVVTQIIRSEVMTRIQMDVRNHSMQVYVCLQIISCKIPVEYSSSLNGNRSFLFSAVFWRSCQHPDLSQNFLLIFFHFAVIRYGSILSSYPEFSCGSASLVMKREVDNVARSPGHSLRLQAAETATHQHFQCHTTKRINLLIGLQLYGLVVA